MKELQKLLGDVVKKVKKSPNVLKARAVLTVQLNKLSSIEEIKKAKAYLDKKLASLNQKASYKKAEKIVADKLKKLKKSPTFDKVKALINIRKGESIKSLLKRTNPDVLKVQLKVAEKLLKLDNKKLSPKQKEFIKKIKQIQKQLRVLSPKLSVKSASVGSSKSYVSPRAKMNQVMKKLSPKVLENIKKLSPKELQLLKTYNPKVKSPKTIALIKKFSPALIKAVRQLSPTVLKHIQKPRALSPSEVLNKLSPTCLVQLKKLSPNTQNLIKLLGKKVSPTTLKMITKGRIAKLGKLPDNVLEKVRSMSEKTIGLLRTLKKDSPRYKELEKKHSKKVVDQLRKLSPNSINYLRKVRETPKYVKQVMKNLPGNVKNILRTIPHKDLIKLRELLKVNPAKLSPKQRSVLAELPPKVLKTIKTLPHAILLHVKKLPPSASVKAQINKITVEGKNTLRKLNVNDINKIRDICQLPKEFRTKEQQNFLNEFSVNTVNLTCSLPPAAIRSIRSPCKVNPAVLIKALSPQVKEKIKHLSPLVINKICEFNNLPGPVLTRAQRDFLESHPSNLVNAVCTLPPSAIKTIKQDVYLTPKSSDSCPSGQIVPKKIEPKRKSPKIISSSVKVVLKTIKTSVKRKIQALDNAIIKKIKELCSKERSKLTSGEKEFLSDYPPGVVSAICTVPTRVIQQIKIIPKVNSTPFVNCNSVEDIKKKMKDIPREMLDLVRKLTSDEIKNLSKLEFKMFSPQPPSNQVMQLLKSLEKKYKIPLFNFAHISHMSKNYMCLIEYIRKSGSKVSSTVSSKVSSKVSSTASSKVTSTPVYCVPRPVKTEYKMKTTPVRTPEVPTVYSNSKTYKVGNLVKFKGWIYEMVEAAGAAGYAPDRQGDKLWKKKSQDMDFLRAKQTSEESERAKRAKDAKERAEEIARRAKLAKDKADAAARKAAQDLANARTAAEKKRAVEAARKAEEARKKAEEAFRLARERKMRADIEAAAALAKRKKAENDARLARLAAEEAKRAREAKARADAAAKRAAEEARRAKEAKDKADAAAKRAAEAQANARTAAEKAAAEAARKKAAAEKAAAEERLRLAREAKMKADAEAQLARDRKKKADDDTRKAKEAAEKKAKEERERKAREEAIRKAKEEALKNAANTINKFDGLRLWIDASNFKGQDNKKIQKWNNLARDSNLSFGNNSNNKDTHPTVLDNVLNKLPVLEFKTFQNMELNGSLRSEDYTMIFLARQIGGTNRRLLIGNGNRLLGYWNGGKDQLYMEGWLSTPGSPPSNKDWDLYTIRRLNGKTFMSRFGETTTVETPGGQGFDGLYVNKGGCCGGETSDGQIAEVAVWNRALNPEDMAVVQGYMAWKWGLNGELAENHPHANKPTELNTNIMAVSQTLTLPKTELNLIDGLKVWFDTSKITQTGSIGELISSAVSRKPNSFVSNTNDRGRFPVVKEKALNGMPVLQFNTNQVFSLKKNIKYNEFTMIFLTRQLGGNNRRFLIGNGNRLYGYWNGGKDQLYMEGWLNGSPGGPPSNSEWDIYVIRREADGKTFMHRNGESKMIVNGGRAANLDGLYLNNGGCCGGETSDAQFAELAVWNRSLSESEIRNAEAYMAWKWGLQNELPENHEYANKPTKLNVGITAPAQAIAIKEKLNTIDGIKLWFDASTLKSGSVNELASLTSGRKPYKFINRSNDSSRLPVVKGGELNKMSVLEFNTNQSLSLNKSLKANEFTMVFLTKQLGRTNRRFVIGDGNRLFGYWNGGKDQLYMEGWLCATPGGPPSTKDWDIYVVRREANGRTFMTRNGDSKLLASGGVAAAFDGLHLNTGGCCGGETSDAQFAELAFWNRSLSDVEIKKVEGYMAWKWGLQEELAEGHPFASSPTEWNVGVSAKADSPADPVANRVVWLDSSDQSSLVLSGAKLLQWKDKSGNNNNFSTQEGFQPEVDDDKTIKFNRSFMYSEKAATYPLDAYLVLKLGDLNHMDVLGISPAGRDDFNSLTFGEHTRGRWHNGSSGFSRTPNAVSTENETNTDKFMLIQYTLKNGKYSIRRNGNVIMKSNAYSYNMPNDAIYNLGCRVGYQVQKGMRHVMLNGNIAEMIVYNRPLKSAERKGIEDRLTQKWIRNQPKAIIPAGGFEYQGCYNDSHNRAINRYVGNVGSAKECEQKAKDAGATVFGLQYYGQCFVGKEGVDSSFAKYGRKVGSCAPMGSDWNNQVYLRKADNSQPAAAAGSLKSIANVSFIRVYGSQSGPQIGQLVGLDDKGNNVTKGRRATGKDVPIGNAGPDKAVDGNEFVRPFPGMYHPHGQANQWFQVQLDRPTSISSVKIYNRGDCCQDRMAGNKIYFLDANQNILWTSQALSAAPIQTVTV